MAIIAGEIDAHVGQRMRQRREALGISQGRLGRHLGLTFSQIQKYEKGSNRIGAGRLYQIAAFLDVAPSYFFDGIDNGPDLSAARTESRDAVFREEAAALVDAYAAIGDPETRASVLALVRSLRADNTMRRPVLGGRSTR